MSIAWMLYAVLVGALLAGAASIVAGACRQVGWPTRWVFATALAGILVLGAVAPVEPARVVATAMAASGAPTETVARTTASTGLVAMLATIGIVASDAAGVALATISRAAPRGAAGALVAAWALASTILLALFVYVNVRLLRARRDWPRQPLLGVPVRVASDTGPAVLGFARAEIVVPRSLLERSVEEQRLILAHEHEHLRARDHLLLGAAWLIAIVLPWHPAVWYLVQRIRLAVELDCDARVLRGGARPRTYGALLLDMAAHQGRYRIGALALSDGSSHLERRILAMSWSRRRHAAARGTVLGAMGGLLVLAACEARMPTSAEIASMDVASAQQSASEAGYIRTPTNNSTDYFINGVKASAEEARAVEAKMIGSIEVVKSERASGRDTVFVTTADRMPADHGGMKLRGKLEGHDAGGELRWKVDVDGINPDSGVPLIRGGAKPLFMIDGKRVSEAAFAALKGQDIVSIQVYKGKDAERVFADRAAANGVIIATTRAKEK